MFSVHCIQFPIYLDILWINALDQMTYLVSLIWLISQVTLNPQAQQ